MYIALSIISIIYTQCLKFLQIRLFCSGGFFNRIIYSDNDFVTSFAKLFCALCTLLLGCPATLLKSYKYAMQSYPHINLLSKNCYYNSASIFRNSVRLFAGDGYIILKFTTLFTNIYKTMVVYMYYAL